jgi:hypothetical protein
MNKTAEEILREVFNEWTGKTCSDEQWAEYLAKDSIQLTLTAMHKYRSLPSGVTEQQLEEMAEKLYPAQKGKHWVRVLTDAKRAAFISGFKASAHVSEWVSVEDAGKPDYNVNLWFFDKRYTDVIEGMFFSEDSFERKDMFISNEGAFFSLENVTHYKYNPKPTTPTTK